MLAEVVPHALKMELSRATTAVCIQANPGIKFGLMLGIGVGVGAVSAITGAAKTKNNDIIIKALIDFIVIFFIPFFYFLNYINSTFIIITL